MTKDTRPWTSYIRPSAPPPGMMNRLAERLPKVLYSFVQQASAIRTSLLDKPDSTGRPTPSERVVRTGLAYYRQLLGGAAAGNLSLVGEQSTSTEVLLNPPESTHRLKEIAAEILGVRPGSTRRGKGCLWYNGDCVVAGYESMCGDLSYFMVEGVTSLTPADLRIVGTFMLIFQEQLSATQSLEFTLDQQRLLRRRTIVAQLRPNDLLYQILKRLRIHLPWRRGACIVAPACDSETGNKLAKDWYVAAERLVGTHGVSQRIGQRYRLKGRRDSLNPKESVDRIIDCVDALGGPLASPWERFLYAILSDKAGLPGALPSAGSALIFALSPSEDTPPFEEALTPYVVILSDPRPGRFSQSHLELARRFVSDLGQLLRQSSQFSKQLVELWTPISHPSPSTDAAGMRPDQMEALEEAVLADVGPSVLGVDALQVVQLRRRSGSKVASGQIMVLSVIAVESAGVDSRRHLELVQGFAPGIVITPDADALWHVITREEEHVLKQLGGFDPARVGHLFRGLANNPRPYGTALMVPIRLEDEIGGVLLAYRRKPSEIVEVDRLLLRSLASRLAERLEFRRQLADRARLVACLSDVAAAPDRSSAWSVLVDRARDLLQADHAFLMAEPESIGVAALSSQGGGQTIIEVAHTWDEGTLSVPTINVKSRKPGITGTVYTTGQILSINDVRDCKFFVPLLGSNGEPMPVASELAVPIQAPLSAGHEERATIGVLDALWEQPHEITVRDQSTLSALARHAATLLTLSASREEAKHMQGNLEILLDRGRDLEEAHSERDVFEWLASTMNALVDCDIVVVGKHERGSKHLDVLHLKGPRAGDLEQRNSITLTGWLGDSLMRFRQSELKAVIDRYDRPSSMRRHIPQTKKYPHQCSMAHFLTGSPSGVGEPRIVWFVWLLRFRPLNFTPKEETLLRLTTEVAEAVLRRVSIEIDRTRSFQLIEATRDIALEFIESARKTPEQLRTRIVQRICQELRSSKVCVLYYDPEAAAYDFAARFVYPVDAARTDQPPRPDGVSECVRRAGTIVVVDDISTPPEQLAKAIRKSQFFRHNPQIRSFVAVPLFERSDFAAEDTNRFGGIMYVDFDSPRSPSKSELEFLAAMERFLAECGRITPRLLSMRERTLESIQSIRDPREVFKRVLAVVKEGIQDEIPATLRRQADFRLGGNLLMVTSGEEHWARLVTRASWGERTESLPGVQNVGEGVVGQVAKTGSSVRIDDTSAALNLGIEYLPYLKDMRSEIAVPVLLPGALKPESIAPDVIGVLNIESSLPGLFTRRHEKLLSLFAQPPVSLVLYLAERHGQSLWESRKQDDRFLLDAASFLLHDLTKPVRYIQVLVDKIREAWPGRMPAAINRQLKEMETESRHWDDLQRVGLLYLSQDILETRQAMDIIEQVEAWAAFKKQYKVMVAKPPVQDFFIARGHKDLLGHSLENLYSNSVRAFDRATVRKPRIWISFQLVEGPTGPGQFLDVFYHDNGPGLPFDPNHWKELFRPFRSSRLSSEHAPKEGWGLGLPLVRQMVYLMDGEVEIVHSQPFQDTCFRLRFEARKLP